MNNEIKEENPWQILDHKIAKDNKIREEVFKKMLAFIKSPRPLVEETKTYSTKRAYDFLYGVQLGLEIAKSNLTIK